MNNATGYWCWTWYWSRNLLFVCRTKSYISSLGYRWKRHFGDQEIIGRQRLSQSLHLQVFYRHRIKLTASVYLWVGSGRYFSKRSNHFICNKKKFHAKVFFENREKKCSFIPCLHTFWALCIYIFTLTINYIRSGKFCA